MVITSWGLFVGRNDLGRNKLQNDCLYGSKKCNSKSGGSYHYLSKGITFFIQLSCKSWRVIIGPEGVPLLTTSLEGITIILYCFLRDNILVLEVTLINWDSPFPIFLFFHICRYLPAGARAARERLVLRLLYVFRVCLFVCLCVRTYHVRNILCHTLLCNCSVQQRLEVCRPSYSKWR